MNKANSNATAGQVTAQFLFGLRLGVLAVTSSVLLSLSIVRNPSVYRSLWAQVAVLVILWGLVGYDALLAHRHESWGRDWWIGGTIAIGATVTSAASLPPGGAATSADWAYGVVGWVGVLVLLDRPLSDLLLFLTLVAVTNVMNLVLADAGQTSFLNFAAASIGTIGYPLAAGVAAAALRKLARKAYAANQRAARIRTEEDISASLHRNRQQRYTTLAKTALPLLQGLADGRLDPSNSQVQRACAIEAARMRRLFAEADGVPNQLIHELRTSAEVAERKGVTVELQAQGACQDPPVPVRRALAEAPIAAVSGAKSWARVTVTASEDMLSVTTVSDSGPIEIPESSDPSVTLDVFHGGSELWVEARWLTETLPR